MIKNKQLFGLLLVVLVGTVSLVSFVSALGFAQDYHDKNPLKVGPGETVDAVYGRFQNQGNKSINLKIELIEGGDIATLTDSNLNSFVIPAGSLETPLNVKISIPEEVPEGTRYNLKIRYTDISDNGGNGMITMTQSSTSSIPVLVEKTPIAPEKPATGNTIWIVLIVIIAIILAIVAYLLIGKKKFSGKSK